jgi:hypothetical protein
LVILDEVFDGDFEILIEGFDLLEVGIDDGVFGFPGLS